MTHSIIDFELETEDLNADEVFQKLDQNDNFQRHTLVSITTSNPLYSSSVAAGFQLGEKNDLEYIHIEPQIYQYYEDIIKRWNQRCIIIVDLSQFPFICTRISIINEAERECGDKFSKDVSHHYKTYDMKKEIPFIFVNTNISHSGLVIQSIPSIPSQ